MRRARATPIDPAPMSGNATPLIDMLLVLPVMSIPCVPAETHEVAIALPTPGPVSPRTRHRLAVDAGGVARLAALAGEGRASLSFAVVPTTRYARVDGAGDGEAGGRHADGVCGVAGCVVSGSGIPERHESAARGVLFLAPVRPEQPPSEV